jgi:hypothetical protein
MIIGLQDPLGVVAQWERQQDGWNDWRYGVGFPLAFLTIPLGLIAAILFLL